MKQTLLLFFFFISFTLSAQVTLSINPTVSSITATATEVDVVAKGTIKNESNDSVTIIWKRNIIDLTDGWETAVCDKNLCYIPTIDEMELVLAGGEESNFDVHVYPNMVEGAAIVEVTATDVNDANNTVTGKYLFNQNSTSTNSFSVRKPDVKIFPNPTVDFISLTDMESVDRLIIYNIVGRPVRMFNADYGNRYNVADLPTGMYLVRLLDEDDKTLKTVRLSKKGGA